MAYYINSASSFDTLAGDVKELVPSADMRRRMGRVLKMAVATAMETLGKMPEGESVSAIITATGLGCLADSEKFLRNLTDDESLLNPTPFIQSTFNTAGGQIALLAANRCYNMTYVHRSRSFESALIDAMMQIELADAENVLIAAFDESTPSQHRIMERMGLWRNTEDGEGAYAFVVSPRRTESTVAEVVSVEFSGAELTPAEAAEAAGTEDIIWNDREGGVFHTVSARSFFKGLERIRSGSRSVAVYNSYFGEDPALIVLKCIM